MSTADAPRCWTVGPSNTSNAQADTPSHISKSISPGRWPDASTGRESETGLNVGPVQRSNVQAFDCASTAPSWIEAAVPDAVWIRGEGDTALIAWCRTPSVTLHPDVETARHHKARIDRQGCGGACDRRHEIVTRRCR